MRSITAYTDEIDDLEQAVSELFEQTEGFELLSDSLGIIYVDEDVEYGELYDLMRERWDFPIIGSTTLAMFTDDREIEKTGISIMIMTADDCSFAVGITGELNPDNYREEIAGTYKDIAQKLDSKEKLVITYACMNSDVIGDDIVAAVEAAGGDIAIFGGNASDSYSFTGYRVFCNDKELTRANVMALVSGNISPRFVTVKSLSDTANISYQVTEVHDGKVFKLGKKTFIDCLNDAGLGTDKTNIALDYVLTPFLVTIDLPSGDKLEVTRVLRMLDQENGAGVFSGGVSQNSSIAIGLVNNENVKESVEDAFTQTLKMLEESEDYEFSTMMCISCSARFLALASNIKIESDAYMGKLPESLSMIGMYSYGEYCPTRSIRNKEYNVYHNFTFAIMTL
jgi:hypothetical protein